MTKTTTQKTKVKGTITEEHLDEVREIMGGEVADRLENAEEGSLFLNLLFQV